MRVGLVAPPWAPLPPQGYGGTEGVVDRLARGLQAAGHDVVVATTADSNCAVPTVTTLEHSQGERIGNSLPEILHVMRAYDALREVDIVHDHTFLGPVYAERFPDVRVVTTNHAPFDEEVIELYRRVGRRTSVLAISHSQASMAPSDVPIAAVIHHGIDVDGVPVGSGDGGYLLFLGRMTSEKGAHLAAQVARKAGEPLIIAGKMREEPEHRYFEEQVRPLLTDEVRYVGEVHNDEKLRLLAGARALLNPIRWPEPFGLVMIEALAVGTPVLSFPEGAAPEIVDDGATGFLCDDEAAMASSIDSIGTIDRGACRRAVEERFSTERMVADHVDCYARLLAQHR
jgi:glycosyltransferase involved in cell wall biosynthesis